MSRKYIGQAVTRLDAYDKATGRTRYTDDMCDKGALVIRVLHSQVANGIVKKIDTSEACKVPGVVRIFTCFDVEEKHYFPTAGHPWSTDPSHQDIADRQYNEDQQQNADHSRKSIRHDVHLRAGPIAFRRSLTC